jgi:hypothetical protein
MAIAPAELTQPRETANRLANLPPLVVGHAQLLGDDPRLHRLVAGPVHVIQDPLLQIPFRIFLLVHCEPRLAEGILVAGRSRRATTRGSRARLASGAHRRPAGVLL